MITSMVTFKNNLRVQLQYNNLSGFRVMEECLINSVYSVDNGWRVRPQTESERVGTHNRAEGFSPSHNYDVYRKYDDYISPYFNLSIIIFHIKNAFQGSKLTP